MSSAVVTDQNPASSGNSVIALDQCTGHSFRIWRNTSWGGPSSQYSGSPTSTSFRFLPTVAIQTSDSPYRLGGDILAIRSATRQARRPVHRQRPARRAGARERARGERDLAQAATARRALDALHPQPPRLWRLARV